SAMPHKRNPIKSEQISGLARVLRGNAQAALENVALWHERDISHSSVERVILPDSTILIDHLQHSAAKLVLGLVGGGTTSQGDGSQAQGEGSPGGRTGMSRDDAYRIAQELAQRAWDEG